MTMFPMPDRPHQSDIKKLFRAGGQPGKTFRWRRYRGWISLAVLLCVGLPALARTSEKKTGHAARAGKPSVQEVSPPNWWSGLPNPMLLLRGKDLSGAKFSSSANGISIQRTKVSANGHWAFVWLDISSAPPLRFNLLVRTAGGRIRIPYELAKRHAQGDGFQGFSSADVMYLVMPDRFSDGNPDNDRLAKMPRTFNRDSPSAYHGGDLSGLVNHLDYIQKLGATTLWVTPLYAQGADSPEDYSGYAPVDLYRVNPHFGGLQDYENLADAVHAHGMKLVLDTVLNHVGLKSPWVDDPPAPDWFHGTQEKHLEVTAKLAPLTDPHAPEAAYRSAVEGWLSDKVPDLNQSNPLVKQYLIQNTIWWIETGALDGLRLDTFPNVDRSFWQEFHSVLHALYPHLTAVGEIYNPDPPIVSYFTGGRKNGGIDTGLYTAFDYPGYYALRAVLAGTSPSQSAPMKALADIQRQDWLYPHPERLATFFGNHDTGRFISEPGATPARMKLAFGLIATMRGLPQIYYGDEIGMGAGNPADNRRDFPGGFPGDTNDAFTAAGRTAGQEAMHAWVESLLDLRAHHTVLQAGVQQNLVADDTGFVFARLEALGSDKADSSNSKKENAKGEIMLILMNKSNAPRTFHLDFSHTALGGVQTLAPAWNTKEQVSVDQDRCDVPVGAEQMIVLSAQR